MTIEMDKINLNNYIYFKNYKDFSFKSKPSFERIYCIKKTSRYIKLIC